MNFVGEHQHSDYSRPLRVLLLSGWNTGALERLLFFPPACGAWLYTLPQEPTHPYFPAAGPLPARLPIVGQDGQPSHPGVPLPVSQFLLRLFFPLLCTPKPSCHPLNRSLGRVLRGVGQRLSGSSEGCYQTWGSAFAKIIEFKC